MDKKIEKKFITPKRLIFGITAIVLIVCFYFGLQAINKKTYHLDRSKITVREVTKDDFKDIILVDGLVEPVKSVIVNAPEGGNVETIFAEDGTFVKKGEPLLKLGNPGLMLSYVTQETAIVEQINNLRNLKLSLEREERSLAESLIDIEFELQKSVRLFDKDTLLFNKGLVSKNDLGTTDELLAYYQQKQSFLQQNVATTSKNNLDQISRIDGSIELMERNLRIIHDNIERLLIKAPVTGRLSSFDPVLGAAFNANEVIGKIDVMEGYKIKGQVDEYYLSVVKPGRLATYNLNGTTVELKIKKVLPEVKNGKFEVELIFTGDTPNTIVDGQSLQIRLELSQSREANLIPKGNFFQSSGGQYVFVVKDDKAEKRYIKIGRQNPLFYEVLDGLEAGEKVITSSYEAFKNFEIVDLTN
ncbi:MAG: efflux RND transporter periplasmic adaptor subunit [Chitinophagales bacterium]